MCCEIGPLAGLSHTFNSSIVEAMVPRASRLNGRFSPLALIGIVCIFLVFTAGIVQVAHAHPSGQSDHDCALCVSAHQVIQIVAVVTLFFSSLPLVRLAPEPVRSRPTPTLFFKLASRPPPAESAFA
jgi:hypothetical protein